MTDNERLSRTQSPPRSAVGLIAALALAACGFAALVVSVVFFVRLPSAATTLESLGWPLGGQAVAFPRFVSIDAEGDRAWLVARRTACRISLSTATAPHCHALPDGGDRGLYHARGSDRLLLAFDVSASSARPHVRALILNDADAPARDVEWTGRETDDSATELLDAAWNPTRGRFELFVVSMRPLEKRPVRVIPISPDGVVGAEEPFALQNEGLPKTVLATIPLAAFPSEPPSLLLRGWGRRDAYLLRGAEATKLELPREQCVYEPCVAVASSVRLRNHLPFAVWLDDLGRRSNPEEWLASGEWLDFDVIEQRTADGGQVPITSRRSESALLVPFAGDHIELAVASRGGEDVLVARKPGGPVVRVAREAGSMASWIAVPAKDTLLLVDTSSSRALLLDKDLRVKDTGAAASGGNLKTIVVQRFHAAWWAVVAYFVGLVAFVPLLVLAVRRIARIHRDDRSSAILVASLAGYAVFVASLFLVGGRYIFPP